MANPLKTITTADMKPGMMTEFIALGGTVENNLSRSARSSSSARQLRPAQGAGIKQRMVSVVETCPPSIHGLVLADVYHRYHPGCLKAPG